ncbi:hypothetical protein [Kribbella sp. HUAS MG21]|uniref:hypothetical protein n=1 Tax=Kribbella sp. HUAS MG21 TaxID=3160966 RepID=UPI00330656AE
MFELLGLRRRELAGLLVGLVARLYRLRLVEQVVVPRLALVRRRRRIGAPGNRVHGRDLRLLLRLRGLLLALQPVGLRPLATPALHAADDQLDRVHQRDHPEDRHHAVQRVLLRPLDHPVGDAGDVVQEVRGPVRDPEPAVDQGAEGRERPQRTGAGEVRHDGPEDQRADAEGKRHPLRVQLDTTRRREDPEHGRTGQSDGYAEQEPKKFGHIPKVATNCRHTPQTLRYEPDRQPFA